MTNDNERDAFEAWYDREYNESGNTEDNAAYHRTDCEEAEPPGYDDSYIRQLWQCWRQARAALRADVPTEAWIDAVWREIDHRAPRQAFRYMERDDAAEVIRIVLDASPTAAKQAEPTREDARYRDGFEDGVLAEFEATERATPRPEAAPDAPQGEFVMTPSMGAATVKEAAEFARSNLAAAPKVAAAEHAETSETQAVAEVVDDHRTHPTVKAYRPIPRGTKLYTAPPTSHADARDAARDEFDAALRVALNDNNSIEGQERMRKAVLAAFDAALAAPEKP